MKSSMEKGMKPFGVEPVLRVSFLYGIFGALWVAVSDRILEMLVADPHRITLIQTYKGWVFVAASTLLLYVAVRREFSAREKAEEALGMSEEKYRRLIETANDAIFIADADSGIVLDVNRKVEDLLGVPAERIIGTHQEELYPPEYAEHYRWVLSEAVGSGRATSEALFLSCPDGRRVPVEVSANTIEFDGKRLIQGIFRDITERRRAEERIERQNQMLKALHAIDMAITASLDLRLTLDVLLANVAAQLRVDAACVLLLDRATQILTYTAGKGFRHEGIKLSHLRMGEGYAGQAALERRTVYVLDLPEAGDRVLRKPLLKDEGFVSYYGVPLIAKGEVKGVLEIFHRSPIEPDTEWLDFLQALATQAAIAIDNSTLFHHLQLSNTELILAYDATLEGWGRALELRDTVTEGHTRSVTEMTVRLAREMGVKEAEILHIRRGALLHDIGKIGVPDRILTKPKPLTDEEAEIMRRHPLNAFKMLHPIAFLRPALDIPYCHHERWDGTGYPRGLKGEQIPLAARIFAVVDVWDALSFERPYHKAMPEAEARDYIRSLAGKHFDPRVVEVFLGMKW